MLERQRRVLGEFTGDGRRLFDVLAGGGDLGDDAPLLGLPGVESLAAQHQIARASGANGPDDPGDAAEEGRMPMPISGNPKTAAGSAIRMSAASASSSPPPRQ